MKKTVFITGASTGIGRSTAIEYAKIGYNLILCARQLDKLQELKKCLENEYLIEVLVYKLDVTDYNAVKKLSEDLKNKSINFDILINNAGLASGLDKFQDSNIDDIEKMINVNIKGLIYVTRELIPFMIDKNEGHIINIGSTAGIYAYSKAAVYCATKSAVKVLSDGIRIDTIDTNIKVTTVQPGIVETDFSTIRFHGDKEKAKTIYEGIEALKPEDIAEIIVFISNQPRRVQISDITIMANQQATGFLIHRE